VKVLLDGDPAPSRVRVGHRGQTVLVRASSTERHRLFVLIA